MGMLKEFKEFATKGNVMDLAVGVIIGAAFGKIVDSLVKDIVMPLIGKVQAEGKTVITLADEISRRLVQGSFLKDPIVNIEITASVPGKFASADAEGKLTSRTVEATFVCSSFYRIAGDAPRQATTTTLPNLPRGM